MEKWTTRRREEWYSSVPWTVGANYVPSDAVNDIEMWRSETFNPGLIRRELRLARLCGLNSVRVFLSYAVWKAEGETMEKHFDEFLSISADEGLSVMPVMFDDCAFDFGADPVYGPQPDPVPGVHNSRWVPSPGFGLTDIDECAGYISSIIGQHRGDPRIIAWDLYNEAGNTDRREKSLPLLRKAFLWARLASPSQPLTACLWNYGEDFSAMNKEIISLSDVLSLHAYSDLDATKKLIRQFEGQPILITEWMHRPLGSEITTHIPFFKENRISVWQWGLVKGKTQTNLSWSTMNGGTPDPEPSVWQHDLLYPDGTPYREDEIKILREAAGMD